MEPWSHEFGGEGSFPLLAHTRAALMPLLLPSLQKCMTKTFIYGLTANSRAFQNYSFYRSARIVQNTKNNPPPFLSLRLIVCSLIILQDLVHCFSTKVNLTQRVTFCTLIQFEKCDWSAKIYLWNGFGCISLWKSANVISTALYFKTLN